MNMKRTFGGILTVLGIIGLIYTGIQIINKAGSATTLIVVGLISILFFFSGIGLVMNSMSGCCPRLMRAEKLFFHIPF